GREVLELRLAVGALLDLGHEGLDRVLGNVVAGRERIADAEVGLGRRGRGDDGGRERGADQGHLHGSLLTAVGSLRNGTIPDYLAIMVDGSQVTSQGKAHRRVMTIRCAQKCGNMPRNTSAMGRLV